MTTDYSTWTDQEIEAELQMMMGQTKSSAHRTKQRLAETEVLGQEALKKLNHQSEQMHVIAEDAEDTNEILKQNRVVIKDMKRNWFVRLCCYNRTDVAPAAPDWHRGDEGEVRIKKMVKEEQKRQKIRRRQKKVKEVRKKESWKFWRAKAEKEATGIDGDQLSSVESDSEDDVGGDDGDLSPLRGAAAETAEERRKRLEDELERRRIQIHSGKNASRLGNMLLGGEEAKDVQTGADEYEINPETFEDEMDGDLCEIHAGVRRVRDIAVALSAETDKQNELASNLVTKVESNQDELGRNKKEMRALLGRRQRERERRENEEDNVDTSGVLSFQEKMALDTLKKSAAARFQ